MFSNNQWRIAVIDEIDTMPFGIAEGKQRIYYFSFKKVERLTTAMSTLELNLVWCKMFGKGRRLLRVRC